MSLFAEASDRRNKKINKYVRRFVRAIKWEIRGTARDGRFYAEMNLNRAGLYNIPADLVGDVYERTVNAINDYFNGEVEAKIRFYGPGKYKSIEATIVKV